MYFPLKNNFIIDIMNKLLVKDVYSLTLLVEESILD
jgi:hypothetical protein